MVFIHIFVIIIHLKIYILVHEFCHRFSLTKEDINLKIIHGVFLETDAIVFELLLQDYLNKKFDNSVKVNYKLNKRLTNVKRNCQFYLEYIDNKFSLVSHNYIMEDLFTLYKKNNKLDEEIFKNYYNSLRYNSNARASWKYYGRKEISDNLLQGFLPYGSAHFIGTLLAFYIYQKIKDDSSNIKILTTLFEIIGYSEFEQEKALNKLEKIGIPIVKNGKVVIDDDAINKLILAYQKEVCDINFISVKSK